MNPRRLLETQIWRRRGPFIARQPVCGHLREKDAPMLGFLFGFNARLGRMHYFLGTIALAVVTTAVCFVIAMYVSRHGPRVHSSADLMIWPTMLAIAAFTWMTFTLQCMRFRDIGWDPVCVMPAWVAILMVDKVVAGKFPLWALGTAHHATIVGGLINFALILALMFWPSGDYADPSESQPKPDEPSPRPRAPSVPAERIARAAGAGFGRRAF
jgi:uncharacterized membrane protein YhaH (DUF805 family)